VKITVDLEIINEAYSTNLDEEGARERRSAVVKRAVELDSAL
jgi:hypothetical protein